MSVKCPYYRPNLISFKFFFGTIEINLKFIKYIICRRSRPPPQKKQVLDLDVGPFLTQTRIKTQKSQTQTQNSFFWVRTSDKMVTLNFKRKIMNNVKVFSQVN